MLRPWLWLLLSPRVAESRGGPRLLSRPGRADGTNFPSTIANGSAKGVEQVSDHLGPVDRQLSGAVGAEIAGLLHQPDQRLPVEIAGFNQTAIRLIARDGAPCLAIEAAIERPRIVAQ